MQTTVRLDPDAFRECQYYLRLEGSNFTKFVVEAMGNFIREYRAAHPECVPRGKLPDVPASGSRVLVVPNGP